MIPSLVRGAAVAAALAAVTAAPARADAPQVVVSIKPIHSLVAGVMAGVGEPDLLIAGGGSPHSYALRPSQAQALQEADVVFWVGEALETFLAKPLASLPRDARLVALHEAEGVTLLPYRDDAAWAHHADAHGEAAHAHAHAHAEAHAGNGHSHGHGHAHGHDHHHHPYPQKDHPLGPQAVKGLKVDSTNATFSTRTGPQAGGTPDEPGKRQS